MITDEMMEKATRAVMGCFFGGSSSLDDLAEGIAKDHARAALEAVEPMLRVQWEHEQREREKANHSAEKDTQDILYAAIRAQELDPK